MYSIRTAMDTLFKWVKRRPNTGKVFRYFEQKVNKKSENNGGTMKWPWWSKMQK